MDTNKTMEEVLRISKPFLGYLLHTKGKKAMRSFVKNGLKGKIKTYADEVFETKLYEIMRDLEKEYDEKNNSSNNG